MPVIPPHWVPFGHGQTFKHMARHDLRIWERFIDRYAGYFKDAAYDVAFGGTVPADPDATEAESRMWRYNTAKRVDAIVRNDDELWLCEVRPGSGLSALGAVLGYTWLAEQEHFSALPIIMTVVTDQTDQDTRRILVAFDVQLIELPEPDPQLALEESER